MSFAIRPSALIGAQTKRIVAPSERYLLWLGHALPILSSKAIPHGFFGGDAEGPEMRCGKRVSGTPFVADGR